MTGAPSSTWFTAPPDWHWLIIFYFFLGGLAGGSYFLAATIDLVAPHDRRLARLGYYVAFPCVVVSGLLLSIDLGRPLRFWHMLLEDHTLLPIFKWWSPMSVGSWALLIFGAFSFVSFVTALAEDREIRWPGLRQIQPTVGKLLPVTRHLRAPAVLGHLIAFAGGAVGVFIAGYTGVLLGVTNRPIWSDSPLLGMLFIVSAESTSGAAMLLIAQSAGWRTPGMDDLHRLDTWVVVIEFAVLVAFLVSLGSVFRAWISVWGLLLLFGVVLLGMVMPFLMWVNDRWLGDNPITTPAVLVLVGGFLLRMVVVLSGEAV